MQKKLSQIANIVNGHYPGNSIFNVLNETIKNVVGVQEIGSLYEISLERVERKNKGQFYTPREIADYIVSYLNIEQTQKVIDPSCGCGSFLLAIVDFWTRYGKKTKFENLFGVDIDEDALHLTKIGLLTKSEHIRDDYELLSKNFKVGNSVVENKILDNSAINWREKYSEVFKNGGFDLVIGNPPYKTIKKYKDFDPGESNYYKVIDGSINVASLMIVKGLEILKEGGILAFVLPKTLLHVNSYSKLRKYILTNTSIVHIYDLGPKFKDVRGEQIILILKKTKPAKNQVVEIKILANNGKRLSHTSSYFILQNTFLSSDSKFLIFENKECYGILDKIHSKGISLSRVVCNNIFRGLALNNYVVDNGDEEKHEKILRGKSISKFKIQNVNYIDSNYLKIMPKNRIQKIRRHKLVLQNIFSSESGIVAALDNENTLTLDTVTNIIVEENRLAKYLLGILHSKLINFFLIFGIFNKSKLTMHTDQSYIGKIPIVIPSKAEPFLEIINIVNEIIFGDEEIKRHNLKKLDDIVYCIYKISKNERNTIEKELKSIISTRSWW